MEIAELKKVLDLAKEYNLKSLKTGNIEIHFSNQVAMMPIDIGVTKDKMPTEDEMLFWSAGGELKEEAKELAREP